MWKDLKVFLTIPWENWNFKYFWKSSSKIWACANNIIFLKDYPLSVGRVWTRTPGFRQWVFYLGGSIQDETPFLLCVYILVYVMQFIKFGIRLFKLNCDTNSILSTSSPFTSNPLIHYFIIVFRNYVNNLLLLNSHLLFYSSG